MQNKRTQEQRDNTKIYGLIRSALRRAWLRWPSRSEALVKSRTIYDGVNKRRKWSYICAHCSESFAHTDVTVDHIKPCGTFLKPEDWSTFGPNLFCGVEGLQVLCKGCHKEKTKLERQKTFKED